MRVHFLRAASFDLRGEKNYLSQTHPGIGAGGFEAWGLNPAEKNIISLRRTRDPPQGWGALRPGDSAPGDSAPGVLPRGSALGFESLARATAKIFFLLEA